MISEFAHLIDLSLELLGAPLVQFPDEKENSAHAARQDTEAHDKVASMCGVRSPLIYGGSNHDDCKARNERQQVPRSGPAQCVTLTFERLAVELDACAQSQVSRRRTKGRSPVKLKHHVKRSGDS